MRVYPEIEITRMIEPYDYESSEAEFEFRLVDVSTGEIMKRKKYRVMAGDVLSWKKFISETDVYDL